MASSASTSVVAATSSDAWTLDPSLGVYFHAPSSTYAIPDTLTGQWSYVPAKDFNHGQPSNWSRPNKPIEVEEGEVEDDVGWGGLMDEEEVQNLQRNVKRSQAPTINGRPAHNGEKGKKNPIYEYEDPVIHAYTRDRDLTPPTASREMPKDLLRLVVEKSEMLPVGGIAVIDAREGGVQIGRDRCEMGAQARVRLKEMEVSKTHAVVYWGKTPGSEDDESADEGWWVVELGSTHGTFLTPEGGPKKRLSEPKHSSRPGSLSHNARLTIGSTTLIAHIHPSWPCESCQLNRENEIHLDEGNTSTPIGTPTATTSAVELDDHMVALDSKQKRDNRDVRHRREMASLRDNLLKKNSQQSTHSSSSETNGDRTYVDRSAMRRKLHPTAPPMLAKRRSASPPTRHQEPVSAPPAAPSAFAAGLLASQGWTPGAGLGRNGDGRSQAIEVEVRTEKRGLGAQGAKAVVDVGEGNWKQRGKQRRWDEVER